MKNLYFEDFTGDIYHATDPWGNIINEITTVNGWKAFWREVPAETILRPEMQVIDAEPPFLDPPRTNGIRGLKVFKLYSRHDAGYWKQYTIPEGVTLIQVRALGHHWYSQRDNPYLSEYEQDGQWHTIIDGDDGATLMVGVDPDGGTDPWAASVKWAEANIYDGFDDVTLGLNTFGPLITVFIRSTQLYPFKHSDAYWCGVEIDIDDEPEPVECPHLEHIVTVELMPQDFTLEEIMTVAKVTERDKRTFAHSADDVVALVNMGLPGSAVHVWEPQRFYGGDIVQWLHDRGVQNVGVFYLDDEEPEPPIEPPPPTLDTTPFVPNGIKVGWHTIGGQGQEPLFQILAAQGAAPPTAKFVVDVAPAAIVKQHAPNTKIIGRKIDVVYNGKTYKVEGFSYSDDPIAQADARMELLRETMLANPAVDYWEIVNEQQPPFPEAAELISMFFVRAMQIAESWGKKLALFSFSVGEPKGTVDEIIRAWQSAAQTGIFEAAAKGGHAISLHEYGICPLDIPWQLLRFKFLYNNVILPRGLRIPLYITEYGVPEHLWSAADKVAQFKAYDNELSKIWYVAGAHIYCNPWDPPYDQYVQYFPPYSEYAIAVKGRIND